MFWTASFFVGPMVLYFGNFIAAGCRKLFTTIALESMTISWSAVFKRNLTHEIYKEIRVHRVLFCFWYIPCTIRGIWDVNTFKIKGLFDLSCAFSSLPTLLCHSEVIANCFLKFLLSMLSMFNKQAFSSKMCITSQCMKVHDEWYIAIL